MTGADRPDGAPAPDLSPRATSTTRRTPRRAWGAAVVLAVVLGLAGVVLYQGLSNATVFFCNADEVGRRSECDGTGRFRLQGTVDQGSVTNDGAVLRFTVTYNGATIPVRYQGEPGGIFEEGIPVVVEGRLRGAGGSDGAAGAAAGADGAPGGVVFEGDRILVKHTEQYVEENPDRVPEGAP